MKLNSQVTFVVAVHTGIFFVIAFLIGTFTATIPVIFEDSIPIYHFLAGFSYAFEWLPAILLSGVLLSFSRAFSFFNTKNILRFSPILMKNFKTVLKFSFFCAALCFLASEVFVPLINDSKKNIETMAIDFTWYNEMAENSLAQQKFSEAYFYNNVALDIAGKDKDHQEIALEFANRLELADVNFKAMEQNSVSSSEVNDNQLLYASMVPEGKTATDLLIIARTAFSKGEYFDAHYNAQIAASICGDENPNRPEMLQIASKSWNKLKDSTANKDPKSTSFYAQKMSGFTAIMNNDVLTAYYTFHNLLENYSSDPDVKKYSKISEKMLKEEYFFFEETSFTKHFEIARDIYFTIPTDDGGRILLYIRGLSVAKDSGELIQYLRGFNYISYSKDNKMEMMCRVPFAKLESETLASFAGNVKINGIENDDNIPVILLNSVSKNNSNMKSEPVYTYGKGVPEVDYHYLVLPITLKHFNEVCNASGGAKNMTLFDLFSFANSAHNYGFSKAVFGTELLARVCYPFIMLLLFICSAIFAWNYRLNFNQMFKFTWIFVFPIAVIVMKFIVELVSYGLSITYFLFFEKFGMFSLLFIIVIFLVAIFLAGFRFLGLHGESYYEDKKNEVN